MERLICRTITKTITSGDCPLCGVTELLWLFEKKNRQFWGCPTCGIRLQWPLPTAGELTRYYDDQYSGGIYQTFTDAEEMKTMTARRRLHEISSRIPMKGRWLDVGSANGVFVREATAKGVTASGLELSQVAVDQARSMGLDVTCGALEDTSAEPLYDCITAFDVLEHVLAPQTFMADIAARLKLGGYAALTLPNVMSVFAQVMGSSWWFYIPEEHLHYFSPKTVSLLGRKVGLEPIHVGRTFKPLTFDYGLTQFVEYNPWIYKSMKAASVVIPKSLRNWILPLYIGEMKVIFRKPEVGA